MSRVVIIGAGIGGLTTAAVLAKAGIDVTVLEAHIYPGGCAGTFYHQGFRFDAGATLAGGFYAGGPMDLVAKAAGIDTWDTVPSDPAMLVHLPGGKTIPRWSDDRRWLARREAFGPAAEAFFRWQENTADALWALAMKGLPWPPQSLPDLTDLIRKACTWATAKPTYHLRPSFLFDALRPVGAHLGDANDDLRLFIDAQLLISAQTTSEHTYALYGASALDLPRRGAVHVRGGMGGISARLTEAVKQQGGRVLLRKRVTGVSRLHPNTFIVELERGTPVEADIVVFNLPPWNIRDLLDAPLPKALRKLTPHPERGWGAFMLYLGVDGAVIPHDFPLHHQILQQGPLAEGNSIFLSISPDWDDQRAPAGKRAITISTHTRLEPWWQANASGSDVSRQKREFLKQKILRAVEAVIPGLQDHIELALDATPVTFAYFTGRDRGWVGGFPQINLLQGKPPRLAPNLWMVGDSIFPGQSTAAVALGGLRVADSLLKQIKRRHRIIAAGQANAQ